MANIKITELNAIGSLASNDVLVAVDVSADETHKITTTNLFRTLPDGTAAAPALAFGDDNNTGIYTPAENQLAFSTGGTQRVRIDPSGNVTISGNLQVDGATTTVQSTTVTIDDKNIELGSVASPSNTTADGGGITLKGATDKTIKWINSTGYWTFNTGIEVGGHLQIDDNNEIRVGTAADLVIRHNGADTIFENDLGHVYFSNYADDKDLTFRSDNGSGGITNYLVCDGSSGQVKLYHYGTQKLNTESQGINVTGEVTCDSLDVDGNVDIDGGTFIFNASSNYFKLTDSTEIRLGSGSDLKIKHDGTNSFITNLTGELKLAGKTRITNDINSESMAVFVPNAEVSLFHNNSVKFQTKSDGIDVTGEVQCDSLDVDGVADITGTLTLHGNLDMQDSDQIKLGSSDNLEIYHDGTDGVIRQVSGAGHLYIQNLTDDKDVIIRSDNGSGGLSNYVVADGSAGKVRLYNYGSEKLQTASFGIDVTGKIQCDSLDVDGAGDISGNLNLGGELGLLGTTDENKYIDARVGSNSLIFRGTSGGDTNHETLAVLQRNGAVSLYYDNSVKFATKSDGIDVTGEVQCDSLDVDGAADITGTLTLHGNLDLQDSDKILLGTGDDLEIFHNGSHSVIADVGTGNLQLRAGDFRVTNSANTETLIVANTNGAVELYHDNAKKIETKSDGIDVTGEVQCDSLDVDGTVDITGDINLHANLDMQDNDRLNIGSSNDFTIRHNGTDTHLENDTGTVYFSNYADDQDIILRSDDGAGGIANYVVCDGSAGDVRLYKNGSQKLQTASGGINVTGEVECDSLDVDGAVDVTGNAILRSGIDTAGEDVYTGNGAFIASDADGAFSARSGSNIDHFWHNDTTNTWHFCSDTTYKNNGNANIQGNRVYVQDLLIHAGDDNTHIGFPAADTFRVTTNNTERFRVTSTGALAFAGASNYGTAGQVLKSTGNGAPSWQDIGSVAVGGASAITMNDNVKINFGNSSDLQIHHDGTNSRIGNNTGTLIITNAVDDADIVLQSDNGSGGVTSYLRCDGSNGTVRLYKYGSERAYTMQDGFDVVGELQSDSLDVDGNADISGVLVLHNNLDMQDNDTILMGSGDDFKLFHNGSNSHVQNYTGGIYIDQHTDNNDIQLRADNGSGDITTYVLCDGSTGSTKLFHYGSEKLATQTYGINVQGEVQCDQLDVDGSADITGNIVLGGELNIMGTSDNNKYIDARLGSSSLFLRGTSGGDSSHETLAKFTRNGAAELYYNNSKKIETKSNGVIVDGEIYTTTLKAFNNTATVGGVLLNNNGSIELHQAAHVPFIDFKSSEAEDFDCRIQSTGSGLMFFTGGNGATGERWRIRGNSSLSAVGGAGTYRIHLAGGGAGTSNSGIAAAWATHSDYRLKENVSNISGAIETVKALRPVNFNWIADEADTVVQGFLAHELQEHQSHAVIGEKDAVLENGDIDAQAADYGKVVPLLTAALKEAIAKIETLEAKVAALEAS